MLNTEELKKRLLDNKQRKPSGVYSVCSAHKTVIEAAILRAKEDNSFMLIESTSNQVDQFGGYTGLNPARFTAFVKSVARALDFPPDRIIFGGDHLGPNVWRQECSGSAMEKGRALVKAYVEAGYKKIHLDTSMFCADDSGDRKLPLPDRIVAERAADLCKVCEKTAEGQNEKPLYIIGTEVPVPGGAREGDAAPRPSSRSGLLETIAVHQKAFCDANLEDAWNRVIGVVAQPGLEFSDRQIFYYDRFKARELSSSLDDTRLVFEVHSTDYQRASGLREMVEDHFCILKVGPWLTFRYREALFSLARIEKELVRREEDCSALEQVMEESMLASRPNYWEKYYRGSEEEKRFSRKYSLSDRSRYYWSGSELSASVDKLFANLSRTEIPYSLISQFMPNLVDAVNEGYIPAKPWNLIIAHIQETLALYSGAAGFSLENRGEAAGLSCKV